MEDVLGESALEGEELANVPREAIEEAEEAIDVVVEDVPQDGGQENGTA